MWKNLLYFTQREKSGLIFLIVIIAGIFIGKFYFSKSKNDLQEVEVEEVQAQKQVWDTTTNSPENKRTYFNTNRIERSDNYWNNSKKNTVAQAEKRTYFNQQSNPNSFRDSTKAQTIEKYPEGTKININAVDTANLTRIPGIGQTYATRILKYRQILGGYYSVEQLKEVYGMYEELYDKIIPYFEITRDSIVLIPANKASLDRLRAHPYINFYQAKAILELRKKKGKINHIEELSLLEEFPPEELGKIKNYLSFD